MKSARVISTFCLLSFSAVNFFSGYNVNLYGGATYSDRTNNEYISCREFVPVLKNKLVINTNVILVTYGGDVFTSIIDQQKVYKNINDKPPKYRCASSTPKTRNIRLTKFNKKLPTK